LKQRRIVAADDGFDNGPQHFFVVTSNAIYTFIRTGAYVSLVRLVIAAAFMGRQLHRWPRNARRDASDDAFAWTLADRHRVPVAVRGRRDPT